MGFVNPATPAGRICCHPSNRNSLIQLQIQQTEDENGGVPRVDTARTVWKLQPANLGFVEPAATWEDKGPSPDNKLFDTPTTPIYWGRTLLTRDRYRPARCRNPNLGFIEPMSPEEDKLSSPDQKYFHTSTTPRNWGRKRLSPGSIPPRTVGTLTPLAGC